MPEIVKVDIEKTRECATAIKALDAVYHGELQPTTNVSRGATYTSRNSCNNSGMVARRVYNDVIGAISDFLNLAANNFEETGQNGTTE